MVMGCVWLLVRFWSIGLVKEYPKMLILIVNIYDFDRVFLRISDGNCIVGSLLICLL